MMKKLPSGTKHSSGKPSCLTPNDLIDNPRNLARAVISFVATANSSQDAVLQLAQFLRQPGQ
jgi:hypothetical protein